MTDFFLQLPIFVGLPLFMIMVATIAGGVYYGTHLIIRSHLQKEHERVGRVLFRTSASLLALILSLTFANQRVEYFKIKNGIELEAAQLVDVYVDLTLFGTPEAESLKKELKLYINYTVENGWVSIQENPFNSNEVKQFMVLNSRIHKLQPETEMQIRLQNSMLADIDNISDSMQIRLYSALEEPLNLIYTTVFGVFAVMILFSVYSPNRLNFFFLTIYNFFLGLVLYFVLMMGNPMRGPLQIEAKPFQLLVDTIKKNEGKTNE